jgi:hypothetical protein
MLSRGGLREGPVAESLMLHQADIRFKAACAQTAQARHVLFPLRVWVSRPSGEQALAEARRIVEQFRKAAEHAEIPESRLAVPAFGAADGKPAEELTIEQASKREVRLQLLFSALLSFEKPGDFWARAAAVARATDFLQAFAQQPREKDIEVDVQQGRLLVEKAWESDGRSGASA